MALVLSVETAVQLSNGQRKAVLSWTDTAAAPVGGYTVDRGETLAGVTVVALAEIANTGSALSYVDTLLVPTLGNQWVYQVTNADSAEKGIQTLPADTGEVDPLASTIRYTSLNAVKPFLNIPLTDVQKDVALTQTIISVEVAIDQTLGRSFPDPTPGAIEGIPEAIKQVALSASVAAYTNITGPFGTSGSDDWFGTQDVGIGELVRREIQRNPLLLGYQVAWGIA